MPQLARMLSLALVAGVMVLGFGAATPAAAVEARGEVRSDWGRTYRDDGVLKRGCRNYRYSYAITPPQGEWGLETFLVGPGGVRLSHGAMVIGMDPLAGTDRFRFCRASTRPGVFKIKALVTVQSKSGDDFVSGWLPVTRFRLR